VLWLFDLRLFEVLLAVRAMKTVMMAMTMIMESAVVRKETTMKTMKTMKTMMMMSAVRMDEEEGEEGEREVVVRLSSVVW
jgi:hypothetical protein